MPGFDLGLRRHGGLTHVLDKGLGPRGWADVLETAALEQSHPGLEFLHIQNELVAGLA